MSSNTKQTILDIPKQNYYHRQLLHVSDYNRERDFHIHSRELQTQILFSKGILSGLRVTTDGSKLTVTSGVAINQQGQQIILTQDICILTNQLQSTETSYLILLQNPENPELSLEETTPENRNLDNTIWIAERYYEDNTWKVSQNNTPRVGQKNLIADTKSGIVQGMVLGLKGKNTLTITPGFAVNDNRAYIHLIEMLDYKEATYTLQNRNDEEKKSQFQIQIQPGNKLTSGTYIVQVKNKNNNDNVPSLEIISNDNYTKNDDAVILGRIIITTYKIATHKITIISEELDQESLTVTTTSTNTTLRQKRVIELNQIPILNPTKINWYKPNRKPISLDECQKVPLGNIEGTEKIDGTYKFPQSLVNGQILSTFYANKSGNTVTLNWTISGKDYSDLSNLSLELAYFNHRQGLTYKVEIGSADSQSSHNLSVSNTTTFSLIIKENGVVKQTLQTTVFY